MLLRLFHPTDSPEMRLRCQVFREGEDASFGGLLVDGLLLKTDTPLLRIPPFPLENETLLYRQILLVSMHTLPLSTIAPGEGQD